MALNEKNRWIVLLNKSPKGPLSKEEIEALLEKKILRRNDIAYLVPTDSDAKTPTEWKLLWQFPQFDRRIGPSELTPEERRAQHEPTFGPSENIPLEFRDISPDELILRSRRYDETTEVSVGPSTPTEETTSKLSWRQWAFATSAVSLGGLAVWMFLSLSPVPLTPVAPTSMENRTTTLFRTPQPARTTSSERRPTPRPLAPEKSERDALDRRAAIEQLTREPEVDREAERGEIPAPDEDEDFEPAEEGRTLARARQKNPPPIAKRATKRTMGATDESAEENAEESEELSSEDADYSSEFPED